jgi:hypothetical protein
MLFFAHYPKHLGIAGRAITGHGASFNAALSFHCDLLRILHFSFVLTLNAISHYWLILVVCWHKFLFIFKNYDFTFYPPRPMAKADLPSEALAKEGVL